MALIVIVLSFASVLLGAWAVSSAVEARRSAERSRHAVAGYGATTVREQEMLEPVGERLLAPVSRGLLGLARRLTPVGYAESLKRRIVLAGQPPGYEVDRFLVLKVLAVGSILLWLALVELVLGVRGPLGFALTAGLSALAFFAPDVALDRRIAERRRGIERALPDVLDLLMISVEAGLGFEQALDRTAAAVPGPLAEEARRMLQETRMGASRADALRALDERTQVDDLRTFVLAMLQADQFGISISRILRSQADEMRVRRHQHAQELAQKAPVKMLFPMVVCIFPAIFVVLLAPALMKILPVLRH